jgi:hypothetical protein
VVPRLGYVARRRRMEERRAWRSDGATPAAGADWSGRRAALAVLMV